MSIIIRSGVACAALISLAACGGSAGGVASVSGGPSVLEAFEGRLDRQDKMEDRIMALPGSAWSAVPNRGSADFNGMSAIAIDRTGGGRADDINLVGFAEITADFADDAITGQVTNIQGYTGRNVTQNSLMDVSGRIDIGNATSDIEDRGAIRTNAWEADYAGRLRTSEGVIRLNGTVEGRFRGTRTNPGPGQSALTSIAGLDEDGRASVDGTRADSMTFEIFGLN